MRKVLVLGVLSALVACGGSGTQGFGGTGETPDGGGGPGDDASQGNGPPAGGDGSTPPIFTGDGAPAPMDAGAIITTKTIVYAHTDNTLYSMDPMTMAVTAVGAFVGTASDASTDSTVTDLAVNEGGDVYVNTESAVYKANVPTSPGPVNLSNRVAITGAGSARFYALAFAPTGVLGAGETLVAGDNTGSLWAIDPVGGTSKNLGNFGKDPANNGNVLELSGDIVFYTDASNKATGMATIRSCGTVNGKTTCGNDFLAGIDMNALTTAYTSGMAASSLLGGVYGGSSTSLGNGTGFYEVFGLAAWEGNVFGFTRATSGTSTQPPKFISIDTTSGAGAMISSTFPFTTGGWSGAGVSTKTTITIPPPPPPPPQPK